MTDATQAQFTDKELRSATIVARRVATVSRGLVEEGDVLGTLYLWMWEHKDKIDQWRDEEKPAGYLSGALYKKGLDYVSAERRLRTGSERGDFTYYTPALLRELLPDVWDYENWFPTVDQSAAKGPSRPSEGNNRLAMLSDVASSVQALTEADRGYLRDVFADGGVSLEIASVLWGTTESGARKRVDRILDKLVDRLGGPPPWFPAGRHSVSNARSQAGTE